MQRFFAKYEFTAPYLLCCSDCEPLTMAQLLEMADRDTLDKWQSLRLGYTETQGLPVSIVHTYHAPCHHAHRVPMQLHVVMANTCLPTWSQCSLGADQIHVHAVAWIMNAGYGSKVCESWL